MVAKPKLVTMHPLKESMTKPVNSDSRSLLRGMNRLLNHNAVSVTTKCTNQGTIPRVVLIG